MSTETVKLGNIFVFIFNKYVLFRKKKQPIEIGLLMTSQLMVLKGFSIDF